VLMLWTALSGTGAPVRCRFAAALLCGGAGRRFTWNCNRVPSWRAETLGDGAAEATGAGGTCNFTRASLKRSVGACSGLVAHGGKTGDMHPHAAAG